MMFWNNLPRSVAQSEFAPVASEVAVLAKQLLDILFPALATLAAVLSEDNRALLRLIRQAKPKTVIELLTMSGQQAPNLRRTRRMLEHSALAAFSKNIRQTCTTPLTTEFLVVLD